MGFKTDAVQQLCKSLSSTCPSPCLSALSCQDIELVKKRFSLDPTASHLEDTRQPGVFSVGSQQLGCLEGVMQRCRGAPPDYPNTTVGNGK